MPSPGSIVFAHWFLVPATLVWSRLLMDNPGERVLRAWSHAFLQQATQRAGTGDSTGRSFGAPAGNTPLCSDSPLTGGSEGGRSRAQVGRAGAGAQAAG